MSPGIGRAELEGHGPKLQDSQSVQVLERSIFSSSMLFRQQIDFTGSFVSCLVVTTDFMSVSSQGKPLEKKNHVLSV